MKQRVVMFEPADIDKVADGLERLLTLEPAIGSDDKESFNSIIESLRHQLGSPKADTPVLNEVITAWTVEDIVDVARESKAKGRLTCAEINAVAEKLRRNPDDVCWDSIYDEMRKLKKAMGGDRNG